ncbi:hypothetical protein AAFF_G00085460 [Aldrovandia affinis]|uniref:Uncharacterized protein n=1 Tax=Aldrovandia affinis TaxID=143900 RepID=A0AAD7RWX0_9TELE|nr:hypothetical protein AAFF_G00085460 [Aldrovandia affinis]
MWDEEGLEPLGHSHPCGSYDSDVNSMDILDHLESCDLEEDDLMLDVDLPEDGSLHSDADGMSHLDPSERGGGRATGGGDSIAAADRTISTTTTGALFSSSFTCTPGQGWAELAHALCSLQ